MSELPTVFIIDDDAAVRKGLTMSLRERGFQVESFDSAEGFLALPNLDRPGCLLLDVQMPQTSGLELQDELLKRKIEIPVIFITGHGDIAMTVAAIRKGAIDFLEKPYEMPVLLQRIDEAFEQDRLLREAAATERDVRVRFERLSEREREVMRLLVASKSKTSNRVIGEQLGISHRTVETYRARLMQKMHAQSLPELVDMARTCGIDNP